jgi:hypothetical protein
MPLLAMSYDYLLEKLIWFQARKDWIMFRIKGERKFLINRELENGHVGCLWIWCWNVTIEC